MIRVSIQAALSCACRNHRMKDGIYAINFQREMQGLQRNVKKERYIWLFLRSNHFQVGGQQFFVLQETTCQQRKGIKFAVWSEYTLNFPFLNSGVSWFKMPRALLGSKSVYLGASGTRNRLLVWRHDGLAWLGHRSCWTQRSQRRLHAHDAFALPYLL